MGRRLRRRRGLLQLSHSKEPKHGTGMAGAAAIRCCPGRKSLPALELLATVLGCGRIYRNRRHDNHKEDLLSYQVFRMEDLRQRIVPFFDANPLVTAKHEDFLKFREILNMMERRLHLSIGGLRRIALVQQTMNQRKPSRFLESSEAIRQPTLIDVRVEEMVLPPRRRGEAEERNSLSGELLPCTGAIPCADPLITAKPTPAAFKERRETAGDAVGSPLLLVEHGPVTTDPSGKGPVLPVVVGTDG